MEKKILINTILSLGRMVNQANPELSAHHAQVTFLSQQIAKAMKLDDRTIQDIAIAASLHDVGLLSFSEKNDILILEDEFPITHSLTMYFLFNSLPSFYEPSRIVRYHHINYEKAERQKKIRGEEIPIGSFVLRLADRISIWIDKNKPILAQKADIPHLIAFKKGVFHPEILLSFENILAHDYIWLEWVSVPHEKLFEKVLQESIVDVPEHDFLGLSEVIGYLIDFKSPYTAGHSHCVAAVNHWLVERTKGFAGLENKNLFPVGFLHDIGKLAIPLEILEKPGKLDPLEWSIMRSHAYYSHVALELLYDIYPELKCAPLHHEKLDGTGYPFGLKGKEIPKNALSLAIADVFSALTENRPYRGVMPENEVAKIISSLKGSPENSSKLQEDLIDFILSNYKEAKEIRDETEKKARGKYKEFRKKVKQVQEWEKEHNFS